MEGLTQKHAAEVASLQAAFRARLAAAEEDLQVRLANIAPRSLLLCANCYRARRPGQLQDN